MVWKGVGDAGIFSVMHERRIEIALLIIRVSAAIFLGMWATLKFIHPEWTGNIFRNAYKFPLITGDFAYPLGVLQLAIVLCFLLGLWRFWTYGLVMLMSAAGVSGSLKSYIRWDQAGELVLAYAKYPNNLLLTAIPTLGALIALFLLRDLDNLFSLSARSRKTDE